MIVRAVVVWSGLLVLAILNGAVRELLMRPHMSGLVAHVLSTLLLCAAIILMTGFTLDWMRPQTLAGAGGNRLAGANGGF